MEVFIYLKHKYCIFSITTTIFTMESKSKPLIIKNNHSSFIKTFLLVTFTTPNFYINGYLRV